MGKYDSELGRHRPYTAGEKVRRFIGGSVALGLAYVTPWGHADKPLILKDGKQTALAEYRDHYRTQSPAGKFALQYLMTTTIVVTSEGGSGIRDLMSADKKFGFDINNGCLEDSSYDIDGGIGSPSAVATPHVDRNHPDVLTITAGKGNEEPLVFRGVIERDKLIPVGGYTEDALSSTFECQTGIVSSS